MSQTTLLLWDVDGTLLNSGGAGKQAMNRALEDLYGIQGGCDQVRFAGRTDKGIVADLRKNFAQIEEEDFFKRYIEHLPACLKEFPGCVFPGIRDFLEWSGEKPEVHHTLLTGNIEQGARMKTEHYGLWKYFEFGVYGALSADRDDLGKAAPSVIRENMNESPLPDHTWVIGDTDLDVRCGKAAGFRTLAVTTGFQAEEIIRKAKPDFLVQNFSDLEKIKKLLLGSLVTRGQHKE